VFVSTYYLWSQWLHRVLCSSARSRAQLGWLARLLGASRFAAVLAGPSSNSAGPCPGRVRDDPVGV
jgi:hypothetical protein